jgi:hypothetical protein
MQTKTSAKDLKIESTANLDGAELTASLKLASENTLDITERPFKRGIAANS